jgi:hypothetical protein
MRFCAGAISPGGKYGSALDVSNSSRFRSATFSAGKREDGYVLTITAGKKFLRSHILNHAISGAQAGVVVFHPTVERLAGFLESSERRKEVYCRYLDCSNRKPLQAADIELEL